MPQALVIHEARDLRLEEVPAEPLGAGQLRIRIVTGGICGSDLHYFQHGGFGTVRLREPMVLGHEVAGVVMDVGPETPGWTVGLRVAISPSRPCGRCEYCLRGSPNHCLHMRFYGSAMPWPHVQGAFRQELVVDAAQAHPVADAVSDGEAALAEPLSVALHAVRRAGPLLGRRVLVTGCGPIGALVVVAARHAGAGEVVVTDVTDQTLERAMIVGADRGVNVAREPDGLRADAADKGRFDVLIEASGQRSALLQGFDVLRPGGVIAQVGTGGEVAVPLNVLVAKEFEWRGCFRFHEEFAWAVQLINGRRVDLTAVISHRVPHPDFARAFEVAQDRTQSMKVQLDFTG